MAIKNSEELSQDIENQLLNREVVEDIQDALKKEKATIADAAAEQVADELLDPAALAIRLEAAKRAARAATSEVSGIAPEIQVPAQQKAEPAQGPSLSKGSEGDSEVPVDEDIESAEPGSDGTQEEQQPSSESEQPKEKEQAQTEPEPTAPSSEQAASQKSAAPQSQQAAAPAQKQQQPSSSEQPQPTNEESDAEQETGQEPGNDVPDEKEEGADTDEDGESSGENAETESNEPSSKKSSSEVAPEDEASTAGDLNKEKAAARTAGEGEGLLGGEAAASGSGAMESAAVAAAEAKAAEEAGASIGSMVMPGVGTVLGAVAGWLLSKTPIMKWLLIIVFLLACVSIVLCIVFFFLALYAVCDGFITGTLLSLSGFDCSWADSWLPGI